MKHLKSLWKLALVCGWAAPELTVAQTIDLSLQKDNKVTLARITGCKQPESTYYSPSSGYLYVSHVNGKPHDKDGNGWISRHKATDLKKAKMNQWITGLNAPKGMREHKGTLYVADIDRLIGIDMKSGKVSKEITIKGAKMLNDVSVDSMGAVFVSDTLGSAIYKVENDKAKIWMKGKTLGSPNGLLMKANKLIVVSWGYATKNDWKAESPGRLYEIDPKTKRIKRLTKKALGNLDGVEYSINGAYLVSNWKSGEIYRISEQGQVTVLFNGIKGAADIGYIEEQEVLTIPRMEEGVVDIIQL